MCPFVEKARADEKASSGGRGERPSNATSLTRGLSVLPAAHGTALSYLQVVFAAILGALVFGERPDAWSIVGGALVIGSAFWLARSPSPSSA